MNGRAVQGHCEGEGQGGAAVGPGRRQDRPRGRSGAVPGEEVDAGPQQGGGGGSG